MIEYLYPLKSYNEHRGWNSCVWSVYPALIFYYHVFHHQVQAHYHSMLVSKPSYVFRSCRMNKVQIAVSGLKSEVIYIHHIFEHHLQAQHNSMRASKTSWVPRSLSLNTFLLATPLERSKFLITTLVSLLCLPRALRRRRRLPFLLIWHSWSHFALHGFA